MKKVRAIKSFNLNKDTIFYLDENTFKELKEKGYVEEVMNFNSKIITSSIFRNGKRKVLSKQGMETR